MGVGEQGERRDALAMCCHENFNLELGPERARPCVPVNCSSAVRCVGCCFFLRRESDGER